MAKQKAAVVLTVYNAADFSKNGKRRIIRWLEEQVAFLRANSKHYSKRTTFRYLYREDK